MNYLLNEVLVNSLANSKTFQRFAIRSNAMLNDVAKKTAEQHREVHEKSATFFATFRDEVRTKLYILQPLSYYSMTTG